MWRPLAALVAGTLLPLAAAAERLVIDGATLIDGSGAPAVAAARVVVEGGRIVAVGRAEGPVPLSVHADRRQVGAERLDAGGKWLIPGLIDAHVHLARSASLFSNPNGLDLRSRRDFAADEMPRLRAALPATLARYVASGITAVLDRGGPPWTLELKALAEALDAAPELALSGPMLASTPPAGRAGADESGRHVTTAEEARALVRANAAAGFDLIKVHYLPAPGDAAAAWLAAAADEAHAHGLAIAAHAPRLAHARTVVAAGFDQLVHSIDNVTVDDAFARQLAERGVVYTTTLLVYEGYREVFFTGLDYSDIEIRLGDPAVIETLDDLASIPARLLPPWVTTWRASPYQRPRRPARMPFWAVHNVQTVMAENLRRLAAAGVTIAAGTDAGTIGNLHGPALHRELELMAAAGLSNMAILSAATAGGAAAMGRDDLGAIAVGKRADMVLLDADPLADITNTRRIWRVIKDGVVLDPAVLVPHP